MYFENTWDLLDVGSRLLQSVISIKKIEMDSWQERNSKVRILEHINVFEEKLFQMNA